MNLPREAWNISPEDFPADGTSEEKLWFLVRYAVLAPSSHNTQPWLFRIHGNVIELHADLIRALPVVDPDNRELIMSCGAALFHLRVAIEYFGHACQIKTFPETSDPNLLARLHLGFKTETDAEDVVLFDAIPKRRTNRLPFRDEPVPDELLSALSAVALREGAWFEVVRGDEARYGVADLVAKADRVQWSDKAFRAELAHWLHPNRSDSRDGIPGYAQGTNSLPAYAGPLVIRSFDLGNGLAAKDWDIAVGSPVLAVLGTYGDAPQDQLAAGQALASVLLRARAEDVWASFLNQPIEVPDLRTRLCSVIGREGFPQLLLRMGYGTEVEATPRRPLKEFIVRSTPHTVALTPA